MNSTGRIFRVGLFGESHGAGIGVTIDGCPPGLPLTTESFMEDLGRRKPGKTGTTPRVEEDMPELLSGQFNGFTTGAPVTILFRNKNVRSGDYADLRETPRPAILISWHTKDSEAITITGEEAIFRDVSPCAWLPPG
jgi:chorismate synthase